MQYAFDFGKIDFKYIAFVQTNMEQAREISRLKAKLLNYQHKYGAKITHTIKLKKNAQTRI